MSIQLLNTFSVRMKNRGDLYFDISEALSRYGDLVEDFETFKRQEGTRSRSWTGAGQPN